MNYHLMVHCFILGVLKTVAEKDASITVARAKRHCCMQMIPCCTPSESAPMVSQLTQVLPQSIQMLSDFHQVMPQSTYLIPQPAHMVPFQPIQPVPALQQEFSCNCANLLMQVKLCDCANIQQSKCGCSSVMEPNCNCAALQEQYANCRCGPLTYDATCNCAQQGMRCTPACMPDCSLQCLQKQQQIYSNYIPQQQLQQQCIGSCMPLCESQCIQQFQPKQMLPNVNPAVLNFESYMPFLRGSNDESSIIVMTPEDHANCPPNCNARTQDCNNIPFCGSNSFKQDRKCTVVCMPNCEPQCIEQVCPPACQPMCDSNCVKHTQNQVIHIFQQGTPHPLRPPPQPRLPEQHCVQKCMPDCSAHCVQQACVTACQPLCSPECIQRQREQILVLAHTEQQQCTPECQPTCNIECIQQACVPACQPMCDAQCTQYENSHAHNSETLLQNGVSRCVSNCAEQIGSIDSSHSCPTFCEPSCTAQCIEKAHACAKTCLPTCQSNCEKNARCVQECFTTCQQSCLGFTSGSNIVQSEQSNMQACGTPCQATESMNCVPQCQPLCASACIKQQNPEQLPAMANCIHGNNPDCHCATGYLPCTGNNCCLRRRRRQTQSRK